MERPYLSIAVISYNQEDFISEAIQSVLLQEHPYTFEIIVSDDASTDNTQLILKSFRDKHPDIIKLVLRNKNVGPSNNLYELLLHCSGKYIALLEGDDFWTDNLKLKKQVEFLEINSKYIACTHRYRVVDENGSEISSEYFGPGRPNFGEYNLEDFKNYIYFGLLGSVLLRNIFYQTNKQFEIISKAHPFVSDITLNLILVLEGAIYILDDNMAAHRIIIREKGTNYKSIISRKNQTIDRLEYLNRLEMFARNDYNVYFKHNPRNEYLFLWALLFLIRYPNSHNLNALKKVYNLIDNKWYLIRFSFAKLYKLPKFLMNFFLKKLIQ